MTEQPEYLSCLYCKRTGTPVGSLTGVAHLQLAICFVLLLQFSASFFVML